MRKDAEKLRLLYEIGEDEDEKEMHVLRNEAGLEEQGVENDAVLYLVFKQGDRWENVKVKPYGEEDED